MRPDFNEIRSSYVEILPTLETIAKSIQIQLLEIVNGEKNVDRANCRYKSLESFLIKAEKRKASGEYKYLVPLKEIQDKIGARIIVYYKSDVEKIRQVVASYFKRIEEVSIVPDDVSKFGYEGFHMICKIPNTIYPMADNPRIGDFFELQIKTLYQHAWSQSNHGLGYKPGQKLKDEEVRLLAFIAAQSWGADRGLEELAYEKNKMI